jgi:hypothetical protein
MMKFCPTAIINAVKQMNPNYFIDKITGNFSDKTSYGTENLFASNNQAAFLNTWVQAERTSVLTPSDMLFYHRSA